MRLTTGQINDFEKSAIWRDILAELDIWLEEIRDQLENADLDFDHRTLDQLGGNAKAIRMMKMMPEVLSSLANDEEVERKSVREQLKGGRNG